MAQLCHEHENDMNQVQLAVMYQGGNYHWGSVHAINEMHGMKQQTVGILSKNTQITTTKKKIESILMLCCSSVLKC